MACPATIVPLRASVAPAEVPIDYQVGRGATMAMLKKSRNDRARVTFETKSAVVAGPHPRICFFLPGSLCDRRHHWESSGSWLTHYAESTGLPLLKAAGLLARTTRPNFLTQTNERTYGFTLALCASCTDRPKVQAPSTTNDRLRVEILAGGEVAPVSRKTAGEPRACLIVLLD